MAGKFILDARLRVETPNLKPHAQKMRSDLSGVSTDVQVNGIGPAVQKVKKLKRTLDKTRASADALGKTFALSFKRFASFSLATRFVGSFTSGLSNAVGEAISFEREMVKISQVTGKSLKQLKGLSDEITRLATTFGVASSKLVGVSGILSQAGFSALDTKTALEALAKTELAPTFDDITQTAEAAVALFNQFGKGAGALEKQLGSINAVAANFAVGAGDLASAIRRVGGVFRSSGGSLEELLALFTSVRATTRESAESIATGLRTIFVRIQRPQTLAFLDSLGIKLQDTEKRFVGPFKAVKALSGALGSLERGNPKFVQVAEQLGGFRQISKVIPLLQQFGVAQAAYDAAISGQDSLVKDAAAAQQSLQIRITKVREEFIALTRDIYDSPVFNFLVNGALQTATAIAKIGQALKDVLPLFALLGSVVAVKGLGGFGKSFAKYISKPIGFNKGGVAGYNSGGIGGLVPGPPGPNKDTVNASLTVGEGILPRDRVDAEGRGNFRGLIKGTHTIVPNNKIFANKGGVAGYNRGGIAGYNRGGVAGYNAGGIVATASSALANPAVASGALIVLAASANQVVNQFDDFFKKFGEAGEAFKQLGNIIISVGGTYLVLNQLRKASAVTLKASDEKMARFAKSNEKAAERLNKFNSAEQAVSQNQKNISDANNLVETEKAAVETAKQNVKTAEINNVTSRDDDAETIKAKEALKKRVAALDKATAALDAETAKTKELEAALEKSKRGRDRPGLNRQQKVTNSPFTRGNIIARTQSVADKAKSIGARVSSVADNFSNIGSDAKDDKSVQSARNNVSEAVDIRNLTKKAQDGLYGVVNELANEIKRSVSEIDINDDLRRRDIAGLQNQNKQDDQKIVKNNSLIKNSNDPDEIAALQLKNDAIKAEVAARKTKIESIKSESTKERAAQQELIKQYNETRKTYSKITTELGTRNRNVDSARSDLIEAKDTRKKNRKFGFRRLGRGFVGSLTVDPIKQLGGGTKAIGSAVARITKGAAKLVGGFSQLATAVTLGAQFIQVGATAYADALNKSAEKALGAGDYDTFRSKSTGALGAEKVAGIAGGVSQGALVGAAIGSIIPLLGDPLGKVIGGAIGGVAALLRSTYTDFAALKQIETDIINASLKKTAKSIDDFGNKLLDVDDFQASGLKEARAAALAANNRAEQELKEGKTTIQEKTGLDAIAAALDFEPEEVKNQKIAEGNAKLTKAIDAQKGSVFAAENVATFQQTRLTPANQRTEAIIRSGSKDTIKLLEAELATLAIVTKGAGGKLGELSLATKGLIEAKIAEAKNKKEEDKFNNDKLALSAAANRSRFDGEQLINSFSNGSNAAQKALDEIQFSLDNVGFADSAGAAIDAAIGQVTNTFGGGEAQREATQLKSALQAFDNIKSSDFKFDKDQSANLGTLEQNINDAFGRNNAATADVINAKLRSKFGDGSKTLDSSSLNDFFNNELKSTFDSILETSKPLTDAFKALAASSKQGVELQGRINSASLNLISARKSAIDIEQEASKIREEAGGRKASSGFQFALRKAELESGGRFSLGNGSSQSIANAGDNATARFAQIQARLTSGKAGVAETQGLQKEADAIKSFTRELLSAEKERIASINKSIEVQEKKNKLEQDSLTDLIGGDITSFFEKQAAVGAQSAIVSGDQRLINSFSGSAIAGAFQNLKDLSDAGVKDVDGERILGAGGLLERTALAGLSSRGITDERQARFLAGTDNQLEDANRKKRASADVQIALGGNIAQQAAASFDKSVKQFGIFTNKVASGEISLGSSPRGSAATTSRAASVGARSAGGSSTNGVPRADNNSASPSITSGGYFSVKDQKSFDVFLTATQKLTDAVDRLSQSEIKINLAPTSVNVNISAPELLQAMGPAVQKVVYDEVVVKLAAFAKNLEQGKQPSQAVPK